MPLSEIQGQVERITYFNEENSYTVAKVHVPGRRELVTVLGNFPALTPGEVLKLSGEWTNHPKFGEQFKVVNYETVTPATAKGIEKYLGSGLIKGVGPVTARRIVRKFGVETLNIIESDIGRLSEIPGIGPGRVKMISKAWAEQKEVRDVMIFLQDHGVSTTYGSKIYRQYGNSATSVIKANPYRLAQDIFGIGFLTADRIAEKLGIPKESLMRAQAGVMYVLNELSDEGHVYYPYEPLVAKSLEILGIKREVIIEAVSGLFSEKKIIMEDLNPDLEHFNENNKAVFLSRFFTCESGVAGHIKRLLLRPKQLRPLDLDKAVLWVENQFGIALAEKQIEAVKAAVQEKVMVVTGGPGTGKTTIVKSIIRIHERLGQRIMLAAPTGRAAKRLSEATDREAKTIHRLLEYQPRDGRFKKDESDSLETDVLIVDEASMIDTVLMYHLLKAIPHSASLILVGDTDQLPSVGPGTVLRDFIASGLLKVVELDQIFRQARESLIVVNAHRVNKGKMPAIPEAKQESLADFYFVQEEDPEKALGKIIEMIKTRIPVRFKLDPISDIQVLTPMYKGILGALNLNAELQKELNRKNSEEISRGGRVFKINDKVMQIRNNYDKGVFNGDIGRISGIDLEAQEVTVNIDERTVSYDFSELDELVLAYAVSVHKSQGSEYPAVIIPVVTQHYMLLQRNLLYTAITRARKLAVLIGTKKALGIAINNNKIEKRYTRLAERLKNL